MRRLATPLAHLAGEPTIEDGDEPGMPSGPVQRCQNCQGIIQDARGAMVIEGSGPLPWWNVGGYVLIDGPCMSNATAAEVQAFECAKRRAPVS